MRRKVRYRFVGCWGGRYHWESVLPVSPRDSRHEHVSCRVAQFWSAGTKPEEERAVLWIEVGPCYGA